MEDPNGLRSGNELHRQAEIESLHARIFALPDFPDEALEIRSILSDIVGLLN